jgi:diaphanous 1
LPYDSVLYEILAFPYTVNPFTRKAKRTFRFCIPEEWFRRPDHPKGKSRNREANTLDDKNDSEGEGTAKAIQYPAGVPVQGTIEKDLMPQNTLSSIFTGFLRPMSPDGSIESSTKRKTVSEPVLVKQHTGSSMQSTEDGSIDSNAFEAMLVCDTNFFVRRGLTSLERTLWR